MIVRTSLAWNLLPLVIAMALVVTASNLLVQIPFAVGGLESLLTWGAWTYPIAFLVTDLTNRSYGPKAARLVVGVGFVLAVVLSVIFADMRIALASGTAFAVAQLLDVSVFDRLRRGSWWLAPSVSSISGSIVDTALFFTLAFAGSGVGNSDYSLLGLTVTLPTWIGWASGDFVVKVTMLGMLLLPYRVLSTRSVFAR